MIKIGGINLYFIEDVAKKIDRSTRSLRRDIVAGKLKGTKISFIYVFTDEDIENYAKARRIK